MSRQKESDADQKSNSGNRICCTIENTDRENVDGTQSMFVLTILEKIKETRIDFSQGSVTVL